MLCICLKGIFPKNSIHKKKVIKIRWKISSLLSDKDHYKNMSDVYLIINRVMCCCHLFHDPFFFAI